jgi:GNAT superfamily N-acetyltransferase
MADESDTEALSHLISLAFHDLDPSAWLIPDTHERRQLMPGYFGLLVADALERGHIYTTPERTAVALWLSVDEAGPSAPAGYDEALPMQVGPWLDRFKTFDAELEARHPAGLRHDHLAILAVNPARQRRGIATELLGTHHARLDQADPPISAYLEASDAHTRQIYLARGYVDHGDPIRLPSGPAMFPMIRPARAAVDAPAREAAAASVP